MVGEDSHLDRGRRNNLFSCDIPKSLSLGSNTCPNPGGLRARAGFLASAFSRHPSGRGLSRSLMVPIAQYICETFSGLAPLCSYKGPNMAGKRKRNRIVNFRLSEDELQELQVACKVTQARSVSALTRSILFVSRKSQTGKKSSSLKSRYSKERWQQSTASWK